MNPKKVPTPKPPKEVWISVHPSGAISGYTKENARPGLPRYRLVHDDSHVVAYLVKKGAQYATGARTWTKLRAKAFRFRETCYGPTPKSWRAGAKDHARTLVGARIVKLVRKRSAP